MIGILRLQDPIPGQTNRAYRCNVVTTADFPRCVVKTTGPTFSKQPLTPCRCQGHICDLLDFTSQRVSAPSQQLCCFLLESRGMLQRRLNQYLFKFITERLRQAFLPEE